MNFSNVAGVMQMAYQYANRTQKTAAGQTSFTEQLKNTAESNGAIRVDEYTEYLKSRYGANVMVRNVGKDQKSFDSLAGTVGYNNVVIAPNILEQMANDPEKAAYYENKIQKGLNDFTIVQAQLSAAGFQISSYGVCVHPDGTVSTYTGGDLKPEVRAKIEAKMKAEDEEKAKRKKQYQERSEEAAAERRRIAENQYHAHLMEQMRNSQIYDSSVGFYIVGQTQPVVPAVSAYERTISTINSSMIQGI